MRSTSTRSIYRRYSRGIPCRARPAHCWGVATWCCWCRARALSASAPRSSWTSESTVDVPHEDLTQAQLSVSLSLSLLFCVSCQVVSHTRTGLGGSAGLFGHRTQFRCIGVEGWVVASHEALPAARPQMQLNRTGNGICQSGFQFHTLG